MLIKLERKFGKYAIEHLINYILIGYAIGYALYFMQSISGVNVLEYLTLEPYYIIHRLQLWRLITWIIMPPVSGGGIMGIFFMMVMMFFYYQLGNTLEATWGAFKFNVYMFGGMLFTIAGAFLGYLIYYLITGSADATVGIGYYVSTDYLNMSIFLAFALCYPDMQILFMFFIPIRMKWMALIYACITGYQVIVNLIMHNWISCIMIIASLLNFGVFWLTTRNLKSVSTGTNRWSGYNRTMGQGYNRSGFNKSGFRRAANSSSFSPYNDGAASSDTAKRHSRSQVVGRHKCAICGKTDVSDPDMTFRFCSKCNGNYEYCENHLYTHAHK